MRFFNVENDRLLEIKLDNLWLEGRKLKANVSKFERKKRVEIFLREDQVNKGGIEKGGKRNVAAEDGTKHSG